MSLLSEDMESTRTSLVQLMFPFLLLFGTLHSIEYTFCMKIYISRD